MNRENDLLAALRLYFHVKYPNLEECYAEGYEAAQINIEEDNNPFLPGSSEHRSWSEGWWAGFYCEEALYDVVEKPKKDILNHKNKKSQGIFKDASSHITERIKTFNPYSYRSILTDASNQFLFKTLKISTAITATLLCFFQLMDYFDFINLN